MGYYCRPAPTVSLSAALSSEIQSLMKALVARSESRDPRFPFSSSSLLLRQWVWYVVSGVWCAEVRSGIRARAEAAMSRATRIMRPVQLLRHQARPAGATTEKWEFTFRIYRLLWKVSYGPVSHEQNRGYTSLILNHICQEAGRGRGVRLARTNPSAPLDTRSGAEMTMDLVGAVREPPLHRAGQPTLDVQWRQPSSLGFFLAAPDDTPSLAPCAIAP